MMQQYNEIKEEHKDCILFYRLGDFYEMFFDDALVASRELEITLTGKNSGDGERAPMCGVPYHAVESYLAKLVERGYKVAICEQTEDPALAKGIVKREVIQIVTPGTLTSQSMLNEQENNYLSSLSLGDGRAGFAYCDISTGELCGCELHGERVKEELLNEIIRTKTCEILVNPLAEESGFTEEISKNCSARISPARIGSTGAARIGSTGAARTGSAGAMRIGSMGAARAGSAGMNSAREGSAKAGSVQLWENRESEAARLVMKQFGVKSLKGLGIEEKPELLLALGALISYLNETQKRSLAHINRLNVYELGGRMALDKATIRNLEITETLYGQQVNGSLLGVLDRSLTAMGGRKMKQWLREPLNSTAEINRRLAAVGFLNDEILFRNNIREQLKGIYDLERLCGRIACGNANCKDLIALRNSLAALPGIKGDLSECEAELLNELGASIAEFSVPRELISEAICEEPPFLLREGGLIKEGYSKELDELKYSILDGQQWIASLEGKERERTGIKNLKVGFNRVFGYYIEVTKSYYDLIPDEYIRKQTLVNCERFITPELKEVESTVLGAEAKINQLEYELFTEVKNHLIAYISDFQAASAAVASLDVLASFAEAASRLAYVRPDVNDSLEIRIENGRHPVIEQTVSEGVFVSNDTYMDGDETSMLLITGPNMAGKSTYMRQTALIVLMAQVGSFVPAERASIGVSDRIYTRIGASDNLAKGQSTFYVEMSELAYILNTATRRSLIILDEIGRGTSTYDGLSIAWAVAEHLCVNEHIRTMFATHYHELTALEGSLCGLKNLNVDVSEDGGDIVFLYKIVEGSASRSYGIHVAKLAGAPPELLESAERKLEELEKEQALAIGVSGAKEMPATGAPDKSPAASAMKTAAEAPFETGKQISFFSFAPDPVVEKLKALELMEITPSKAFSILEELKAAADKV
ncbi:MAG: DNA mismatch repair protein MutS [Clostridiales Family XIII bacterium]|jgi:DNA mismatch repair protein MutS|nr:DNA mismatch repair protein MutS [Clostridiales Family XIII bacterium]